MTDARLIAAHHDDTVTITVTWTPGQTHVLAALRRAVADVQAQIEELGGAG